MEKQGNNTSVVNANTIKSTKFVYCVAVSGCGKSFTGDYLNIMHDFTHIDGDGPLKSCNTNQRNKEIVWKFLKAINFYADKKAEDGPCELWQPYFDEISTQAMEASKHSDRVVLTHATSRQAWREYVVNRWIEAGALPENITVVQLTIDTDVRLKGLYHRTKFQTEQGDSTMEEFLHKHGWWGSKGQEATCEDFIKVVKKSKVNNWHKDDAFGFTPVPLGYRYLKVVDVSGRDMTHLDGVDKALDLVGQRNDKSLSFEEIKAKVKPLDAKRDENMGPHWPLLMQMFADSKALANGENVDEDKYYCNAPTSSFSYERRRSSFQQSVC